MTVAAAVPPLLIGTRIRVQLRHLGQERQPLLIVDDVLADPEAMIDAAREAGFYTPEHTHYPGLNAPLPESYYRTVVTALRGPIAAAFGLSSDACLKYFGFFALATTPAREAEPIQKIPHHDSPDPERLAMVHYLCRGDHGGTGFFRHKTTDFESVDHARHETYVAVAQAQLAARGAGAAAYAGPVMADHELIGQADCVFNRLIVYRNHLLHSALLGPEAGGADPGVGRLTANGFIEAVTS
ncbi:hypothetical protein ASD38_05185 [Caulobacter sp. Root487D2Y]|uniref:DUF6445 family protein n=1 Tax=Caulobacter sp. Root487D2Y TaxID=1736547 RepID=UPI0006F9F3EF|nr:DUF6445 family protein [Caulobacter sp. Root487D2Y]KQY35934.1 hypothetical protein ASD38_05185 [Caulobacter sp. Root487D2Y]